MKERNGRGSRSAGYITALALFGLLLAAVSFTGEADASGVRLGANAVDGSAMAEAANASIVKASMVAPAAKAPRAKLARRSAVLRQEEDHIDVASLSARFELINYDINAVRHGAPVPRLFVDRLPHDLIQVEAGPERKRFFLSALLPLVLHANELIQAKRDRLLTIAARKKGGLPLDAADTAWLSDLAAEYRTEPGRADELLRRVDIVPPSLALAQSIEESGWGTSRFARHGNALFGQRVWKKGGGIVPEERGERQAFEVRAFSELLQSVQGYMHNLNTHPAYGELRRMRAEQRRREGLADGHHIAIALLRYSERGEDYVKAIRNLIRVNKLRQFDTAKLRGSRYASLDLAKLNLAKLNLD